MSFYTEQIKTQYLTSKFDKRQLRTVFEVPNDKVFYSNMRLLDLSYVLQDSTDNRSYAASVGVYGMIESIELRSGNTVLSQMPNFPSWMEWVLQNQTSDDNTSSNHFTSLNCNSFGLQREKFTLGNILQPLDQGTDAAKARKGWLNLQMVLGVLQSTSIVSTSKLRNLKLIINYKKDMSKTGHQSKAQIQQFEDINLCYDEIVNEQTASALNENYPSVLSYKDVEVERLRMSGNNLQARLKSFNNKYLKRVLIKKESVDHFNTGYWVVGSVALLNEEFQMRLNGKDVLPFGGLGPNRRNQMEAMLIDTWGEHSRFPFGNVVNVYERAEFETNFNVGLPDVPGLIGGQSYIGVRVEDTVKDLQITLKRTTNSGSDRADNDLNVLVFGEVNKVAELSAAGVRVGY